MVERNEKVGNSDSEPEGADLMEHRGGQKKTTPIERQPAPQPVVQEEGDVGSQGLGEQELMDERVRAMIQQAEAAKACMFAATGNNNNPHLVSPSVLIDEGYIVVGAHLDDQMISKIKAGEYVDFGKLIPRDKIIDDDGRMELCIRNGKTFWMPAINTIAINSFARWEQAFRVYSNIYCKSNPYRVAELIEYNHVIYTISLAYTWDNVYNPFSQNRDHYKKS